MPANRWNTERVAKAAAKEMGRRMAKATLIMVGDVKRLLTVGQPVKRVGRNLVGLDPSKAPEPPHKLSARLQQSITNVVTIKPNEVVGRVGTNVEYARRQELGFMGTDSLGRVVHQAARPYLRRALKDNMAKYVRILGAA